MSPDHSEETLHVPTLVLQMGMQHHSLERKTARLGAMAKLGRLGVALATGLAACTGALPASPPGKASIVSVPPDRSAKPPDPEPKRVHPTPGTRELVAALVRAERIEDRAQRWQECRRLLEAIRGLADPRGADALAAYTASDAGWPGDPERVHRRTLAAFALAELGDLRAVPVLASRLLLDPLDVYRDDDPNDAMLRRTDQERIIAARLIGDLATLHPAERERVRAQAQDPVRSWLESGPAPHANGLRALARMQVQDEVSRKQLRAWADPSGALPKPGAMPPFDEKWVIAQSALRYIGALRDDKSWSILQNQLGRRPKGFDATTDALISGGSAMLGMAIRALAMGAASGFAEWGDARAVPLLLKHVEDDKQNEQSRLEACRALGFSLDTASEREVTTRLQKWKSGADKSSRFRVTCLLDVLERHPIALATPLLMDLTRTSPDPSLRLSAARALGHSGFDATVESELVARLGDSALRPPVAIALLLGGSADGAKRAVASYPGDGDSPELSALREQYAQSLGVPSDADLDNGTLFRFVRNARAVSTLSRGQQPIDFAVLLFSQARGQAEYDSGPRSLTRVLARKRLFELARSGSEEQRTAAVDALGLFQERGVLLALGQGSDAVAKRAAEVLAGLGPEAGH